MKTIVISLKHQSERRTYILNELQRCNIKNYEMMDAINGKKIKNLGCINHIIYRLQYKNQLRNYDSRLRLNKTPMSNAELGCAWSHLNIYEKLLEDTDNHAYLVLEDDANITVPIDEFHKFLSELPDSKTYDICHINKSEWYPFVFKKKVNDFYHIPQKRFFNHTTAYIVTKKGAQHLLSAAYPCMSLPADDLLSNTYLFSVDFKMIVPSKTLTDTNGFKSTISTV